MTLNQPLEWKSGKFLEWHTYLPYQNRPQISPALVIMNIDCYFELYRNSSNRYYYLDLKPKSEGIKLEPISLSIYVKYNDSNCSNMYSHSQVFFGFNASVFSFPESHFPSQALNLSHGFSVRFLFAIEQNVGLSLISERKVDDKSVQTPPYLDTRFSLESSSKDFAKLLDDGPAYDIDFALKDKTIKAHKSILSCRSGVFTSMLQSNMVEGETGLINIQDMDASVFQQFLRCLYTGLLPELTVDIAIQLYIASDKYAVDTLKLQFAHFLIDSLSLENACEILALADRHNDSEFKNNVMEYVFKEKIPLGEKWPEFCKENQQLAVEVLNSFCRYLSEK